jgi:hypothetical protein
MSEPARPDPIDLLRDMVLVHRGFRRELAQLAGLVPGVRPGEGERRRQLAACAGELCDALHAHAEAEDALLWPLLLDRAPAVAAPVRLRSAQQHRNVVALQARVEELLPSWEQGVVGGEYLGAALDRLAQALAEHQDAEERDLLPLARDHLSAGEWARLGARERSRLPRPRLPVFLGEVLQDATPQERERVLSRVPLPDRVLFHLVGGRRCRPGAAVLRSAVRARRAR